MSSLTTVPWGRILAGLFAAASAVAGAGVLPPKAAAVAGAIGMLAAFTPAVHQATPAATDGQQVQAVMTGGA